MEYKKAIAILALLLTAAVVLTTTTSPAQALTSGEMRIQLSFYDGGYWHPWNSTLLNLHGENSRFTILVYNQTPKSHYGLSPVLLKKVANVRPDSYGNITITGLWSYVDSLGERFNVTIYWNITTYDGREMSFLVFNGTMVSALGGTGAYAGYQLSYVDHYTGTPVWANNSRFRLAVVNLTVVARDSMDAPYGPNALGGARIVVVNGTNWDGYKFAGSISPAVIYNITTPESGSYAGRATFLIPNTTNVNLCPDDWRYPWNYANYTIGIRVYWNNMLVYNHTFAQSSNNTAWYASHSWYDQAHAVGYRYSPYNFTHLSNLVRALGRPVYMNCSVYAYEMYLLDHSTPGNRLASTAGYLEIEAFMYLSNSSLGTVHIARPRTTDSHGKVVLRYAARCVDEEEGHRLLGIPSTPANLTVYWKSTILGVQYLILNLTLSYNHWSYGNIAPFGNMTGTNAKWFHCYANYTYIQLVDSTDPTYPQPLFENTQVTLTFPGASPIERTVNNTGFVDLSFVNYTLPLRNGLEALDDYHIAVNYLGVQVLDTDFDPNTFSRYTVDGILYPFAFKHFVCNVYLVEFHLYDAHNRNLANMSQVKLVHPTGATFTITIPAGGSGTWRIPGGSGYTLTIRYKSDDWLEPLNTATFDVASNKIGADALTFKAPVYDVFVKITNFEKTWWVEGVNACFTWSYPTTWTQWGNMSSTVSSQSRSIEPVRYILLYQIPKGTHTLAMYADSTPGLERYFNRIGEYTITVVDSDVYDNKVNTWIFDPKITILTADGEVLPAYTLAANTTYLVTVFNVSTAYTKTYNSTNGLSYIQLYTNITQQRVFVGGATYNFTIYAGGVTVYGPSITFAAPPTTEIEVTTSIHKVTFVTKDYEGEFTIPNLKVTVYWTGINYTYFRSQLTAWITRYSFMNTSVIWSNWTIFRNVDANYAPWVSNVTRNFMLYNVSSLTNEDGEVVFYIPVWCYSKRPEPYHTPIEYNVTTVPGTTPDVPSDLKTRSVIYRRYPTVLGTNAEFEYHAPWFYNVSTSETKTLNVYAASFKVRVVDSNNRPLEGYYVKAIIKPDSLTRAKSTHIIGQAVTDSDGWAYVTSSSGEDTIYWCNYSYVLWIYRVPAPDAVDQDGNAIVFDYYVVKATNFPFRYDYSSSSASISTDRTLPELGGWDPWMWNIVQYAGTISVDLVDAYNEPLQNTIVVAKATSGAGTGHVIAYGFTDEDGKANLLFPEEVPASGGVFYYYGYYNETDDTYRLESCSSVNLRVYWTKKTESYKVFWDVQVGAADGLSPDSHVTLQCAVYYAKLRFVSDTGRALEWAALEVPEGTDVGIPFKVTFYLEGQPREDVYVLEGFTLANATFNVNRCPIGDYRIEAWWPNYRDIKIYDTTISIDSNLPGPDVAEPVHDLKCLVYDITLNFKTPRGTVCDNAEATIVWPQGVTTVESSDANGNVELINVPTGTLTIQSLTWHGWDAITASIEKTIQATTTYYITADNIVTLNIKVVGARGQGLPYASVVIEDIATLTADESGVAWYELPRIPVTVRADYRGKTAEITVDLSELAATTYETTATVQLDVFIELFGYAMSASEFALAVILTIIIVLVVAFIIHEYIVWRRKRIAAAVVRA